MFIISIQKIIDPDQIVIFKPRLDLRGQRVKSKTLSFGSHQTKTFLQPSSLILLVRASIKLFEFLKSVNQNGFYKQLKVPGCGGQRSLTTKRSIFRIVRKQSCLVSNESQFKYKIQKLYCSLEGLQATAAFIKATGLEI